MKKLFSSALILSGTMFLAACGGGAEPAIPVAPGGEEATAPTTPEPTAPESDTTQLTLWHIQTFETRAAVIQDAVDRFVAANPQYTVEVVPIMNDVYKQTLIIAMAANELPDIFVSWAGGPMIEYLTAGHLYDMTDMFNATNLSDRILPGAIAQGQYNGRQWGIPTENVAIAAVYYNRDIFARLGLTVPNTIGELENVAETLVDNGYIPFALANASMWTGSMYYMNLATRYAGLEPFQTAVIGTGSFEHPSFEFAGSRIQDWVERGFFAPGFNGADEDAGQSRQLLYAELAAMHIMGNWFISQVQNEYPEFLDRLGVFNFPAYENSNADPNIVIGTLGDNFMHISSSTSHPQSAFDLITFIIDDQAMAGRQAAGALPPVIGLTSDIPLAQEVLAIIENATAVQLWYDQYLPPAVAQAHLNSSQELFGLTMTPQEANAIKQAAIEAHRDE